MLSGLVVAAAGETVTQKFFPWGARALNVGVVVVSEQGAGTAKLTQVVWNGRSADTDAGAAIPFAAGPVTESEPITVTVEGGPEGGTLGLMFTVAP